MKKFSKLFTVVAAMAMVFSFSLGVAAADPYYVVGDPVEYSNPIDVKVVIESRQDPDTNDKISEVIDVTLGETGVSGQTFDVQDAMYEISSNALAGITMYAADFDFIDADTNYIYAMEQDGNVYMPGLPMSGYELDGWMFRLNGQIPLLQETPELWGAATTDTPIADGDVIHFYWDYPFQETSSTYYSANFVYPEVSYAGNAVTVQLQDSYNWYANDYTWTITPFANLALGSKTVTVYDAAGTQIGSSEVTDPSGAKTINTGALAPGTYYVKADTTSFKPVDGYDENWDDVTYQILDKTMGYAKLVVL